MSQIKNPSVKNIVAKNENKYLQNKSNLPSVPLLSKELERLLTEIVTYINNDHSPKAKEKTLNPRNTHKHASVPNKIIINTSVIYLMPYKFNNCCSYKERNNQV